MFGAIAGGIASALAGGAMSKLFGGGQKAASGGIQGDVLATDNNTVGMGDAGIKSAIQGSNVPNPDRSEERFSRNARDRSRISTLFPYTTLFRSGDLCLVLLLAVLLLLLLVAPCLNCLEAVKKPPPVAFKVMCLLPITIL